MEKTPSFHGPRPRPCPVDHPNHPANKSPRTSGTSLLRFVGRGTSTPGGFLCQRHEKSQKIGGKSGETLGKMEFKAKNTWKTSWEDHWYDWKRDVFDLELYTLYINVWEMPKNEAANSTTLPVHQPATIPQSHLQEPHSHPQITGF